MATIPRRNDILFGKGTAITSHQGNRNFRLVVELQKEEFQQTEKRARKNEIAMEIVRKIKASGGRFLMDSGNVNVNAHANVSDSNSENNTPDDDHIISTLVTDPAILGKVWIPVEQNKALSKVKHKLREKKRNDNGIKDRKRYRDSTTDEQQQEQQKDQLDLKSPPEMVVKSLDASTSASAMDCSSSQDNCKDDVKAGMSNILGKSLPDMKMVRVGTKTLLSENRQQDSSRDTTTSSLDHLKSLPSKTALVKDSMAKFVKAPRIQDKHKPRTGINDDDIVVGVDVVVPQASAPSFINQPSSPSFINQPSSGTSALVKDSVAKVVKAPRIQDKHKTCAGINDDDIVVGVGVDVVVPQASSPSFINQASSGTSALVKDSTTKGVKAPRIQDKHKSCAGINDDDIVVDIDVVVPPASSPSFINQASSGTSSGNSGRVNNSVNRQASARISIKSTFQRMLAGRTMIPNNTSTQEVEEGGSKKMSIPEWIRSSKSTISRDDYVKSAVDISWRLTKHLIQLVNDARITLSDMTVDNVIIFVEEKNTTIANVQFANLKFYDNKWSPVFSSAVTVGLGSILLELFSMGRSGELNKLDDCSMDIDDVEAEVVSNNAATSKNSVHAKANDILSKMGMPLSISRLVCDLLNRTHTHEPCPSTALTSLEDALWDLTQMKESPQSFLFDRTCPKKALADTCLYNDNAGEGRLSFLFDRTFPKKVESDPSLFNDNAGDGHLFGRKKELGIMMGAKKRIADHFANTDESSGSNQPVLCETIFLSGYAGSGKSALVGSLVEACDKDGWLVGIGKFDKHSQPHEVIAKTVDSLFKRSWKQQSMLGTIGKIIRCILSAVGKEGFDYIQEIVPALGLYPILPQFLTSGRRNANNTDNSIPPSMDEVGSIGSAHVRRKYFMQVLGNAICSVGLPVILCLDDLHWGETFMMELLGDFLDNLNSGQPKSGFLLVGTFRTNEVTNLVDDLLGRVNNLHLSNKINSNNLTINNLTTEDITVLLGTKLCLPLRYCKELARLIHWKTVGNPFFIVQFMKTVLENKMLEYSVNARSWIWDCEVIEFQMISKGVAKLLTTRLNRLPLPLIETLKLASCFGSEVEISIMNLLNVGLQIPYSMKEALDLAVKEGLMDKAGPIYAFTHDLIQEAVYKLMPAKGRKTVHKDIGTTLLRSASNNPPLYLLAVAQINLSWKDADISPEERAEFAQINTTAAKFAIASSSFEQARSHIDAGIKLLGNNQWQNLYSLSLELFELSATVSCMHGDIENMSKCLAEVIANVRSFEDSLTSSSLLAKFLADSSEYDAAMGNCINILSKLGEEISTDVSLSFVMDELAVLQTTLANITVDQLKLLPPMTNTTKLNAMRFLSELCRFSAASAPMLVPILGCRMVRLTIEHGFCDGSIVGFVTAGCGLSYFCDDINLAYRIGKVCDKLIEESLNRNALRSRLCSELDCKLFGVVDPRHQITSCIPDRYKSAMITGDMESAMQCLLSYATFNFSTAPDLQSASQAFIVCLEQSAKYKKHTICHLATATFRACIHLTRRAGGEAGVKSYEELKKIGESTNNMMILHRIAMSLILDHFYDQDYIKVVAVHSETWPSDQLPNLVFTPTLYMGVAFFNLARQTHQVDLREKGKECLEKMLKLKTISKWNYESSANLLEAEFLYLNGNLKLAEEMYNASIKSAQDHECIQEEALSLELFGIFCIENQMTDRGVEKLHMALAKYEQWGAMKKAEKLQDFIDVVDPTYLRNVNITV